MEQLKNNSNSLLKVFVYGTLKPGEANYQHYCAAKVVDVKRAIAFGQLFALPLGYPAMTPGKFPVQGFLLSFPDLDILPYLDLLEGYNPQRQPLENEYERRKIEAFDTAFNSLGLAWVYLMTTEQVNAHNGIFLPNGWWSSMLN